MVPASGGQQAGRAIGHLGWQGGHTGRVTGPWITAAIVLALIVLNGALALAEMALASSRRARLEERAGEARAAGRAALESYDDPTRFLSTVQIGITLVGVSSGALGGSALSAPLATRLMAWGVPEAWADGLAFTLVVAAITYLSLVIGELVPKRLALTDPERWALRTARPMARLSRVTAPLVTLLSASTHLLLRPFGVGDRDEEAVTAEEISTMVEQGRRTGRFGHAEVEMIQNVFDLRERRIRSMITPRRDVHWLDLDDAPEVQRDTLLEARHSRLPVARGELDRVEGVVRVHALLDACLRGEPLDVRSCMEPALIVPESLAVVPLLERFRDEGTRFAIVLDEYGGVEGIVTAGDVLAALLGEFATPEEGGRAVHRIDGGGFALDGTVYLEDLKDLLQVARFPREEERNYRTLAGLVTFLVGRIPSVGDATTSAGWRFEVTEMEGPRILRVTVTPEPTGTAIDRVDDLADDPSGGPADGPADGRVDEANTG